MWGQDVNILMYTKTMYSCAKLNRESQTIAVLDPVTNALKACHSLLLTFVDINKGFYFALVWK